MVIYHSKMPISFISMLVRMFHGKILSSIPPFPPSKSLLVWRSSHNKLPTDDNLSTRGCYLPSMCSLCNSSTKTTYHLLLHYSFANSIWQWHISLLNTNCNFSLISEVLDLCNRKWAPKCKLVILAAVINTFNTIWFCRNQIRFNDKKTHYKSAINLIISNTDLCGIAPNWLQTLPFLSLLF